MSSSGRYAAPMRLEPRFSRQLLVVFVISLAGAVVLPWMVVVPLWWRLGVVAASGTIAVLAWRDTFGRRRIVRAVWDENGAWQLMLADGREVEADLGGKSFLSPELVILAFRAAGQRHYLVVLPDTLDAETRRRLRVRLRLEGAKTTERRGLGGSQPR